MGSEGDSKKIEESVGGLVWVRRRNGSWWPGRIMGLHELPESCLVSPRSGTPVKLLGRDDASVDWYNLDKSRRVKAFRCGEYDECIEKAKASAASSGKKAVKYARREDAILHALEIENNNGSDVQLLFESREDSSSRRRHSSRVRKPKHMSSSESEPDDIDGKERMFEENKAKELSQSGLTFEDPNSVSATQGRSLQKTRRRTPNDSEDDGSEGTKRMRGLEDLGMGVLSKEKASVHSDSEGSDEFAQQDSISSEPNACSSFSNGSPVSRSKDSCSILKKRQPQVGLVHENMKRKNRCVPLTKVMESTTMVSVPVYCDQSASPGRSSLQGAEDNKVPGLESTDSKMTSSSAVNNKTSNCTVVSREKEVQLDASYTRGPGLDGAHAPSDPKGSSISSLSEFPANGGSDGLFDVPFVGEEKHSQGPSEKLQSFASERHPNRCSVVGSTSLHSEGLDESGSTSLAVDIDLVSPMVAKHTSKWQMKGKRNSRTQSHRTSKHMDIRRSVDRDLERDVPLTGKYLTDGFSQGFGRKVEIGSFDESPAKDSSGQWSGQVSEPNYLDSSSYGRWKLPSRECIDQSTNKRLNLSHENGVGGKLVETHARNKELYLGEEAVSPPLPYRSLPYRQSRFTPHSKYQDAYVPARHAYGSSSLYDVNVEVRTSYRGRHVPLVSLMSKLNGKAIVGHPITVEVCDEGYCDRLLNATAYLASSSGELYEENTADQFLDTTGRSLLQVGLPKPFDSPPTETGYRLSPVAHLNVKSSGSPKKSPKARKCGLLSKKTRKLSSFVAPVRKDQERKPVVEKLGGPVIACVPLNIVFSRINEALNGSVRSAHRKVTPGNL